MIDTAQIRSFLQILGERLPSLSRLYLVGGGALVLLGSPRLTIDIDFTGDDIAPSELHKSIMQITKEQIIYIKPVAIERFIPLPDGSEERTLRIGLFGNLKFSLPIRIVP